MNHGDTIANASGRKRRFYGS
ncbi:BnaC02g19730D [Brassica napus]|uniref:BnaC02g19730D protein n=1 Tax=Brassica napus TaxID=3708 RepID=A0A078I099_BRANA|nr:BnaC02g19730D [Brassica napus]